jgi:Tfp pilus assembly protein FimV
MIPADFSAFNGFNIAKHSYWEKTAEEINTYLTTGQFPGNIQTNNQQTASSVANVAASYNAPTASPAYPPAPASYSAPANPAINFQAQQVPTAAPLTEATPTVTPAPAPVADAPAAPTRNFSGFSF